VGAILFNCHTSYAQSYQFKDKKIIVPSYTPYVADDKEHKVGSSYQYQVKGQNFMPLGSKIEYKRESDFSNPYAVLRSLVHAYVNHDFKAMLKLHDSNANKKLKNLGQKNIKKHFSRYTKDQSYYLHYAFEINGGVYLSWSRGLPKLDASNAESTFLKKKGKSYKVSSLLIDDTQDEMWNVDAYYKNYPLEPLRAKVVDSFSTINAGEFKSIKFKTQRKNSWITLFKVDPILRMIMTVTDNRVTNPKGFNDSSSEEGLIEIALNGKNFKPATTHTIYAVETSYAILNVTKELLDHAHKFEIKAE